MTPFQIHILLGMSDCDGDGIVPYKEFAKVCQEFISENFKFEDMVKKQQLYGVNKHEFVANHPESTKLDAMELFRTFKKYDRNANGTLEFPEYIRCLDECPGIKLTKPEIITTALSGDMDGSGAIDFEEFMKHFQSVLDTIYFNRQLQNQLDDFKGIKRESPDEVVNEAPSSKIQPKGGGAGQSSF